MKTIMAVAAGVVLVGHAAFGGVYTIGDLSFNSSNAVATAETIEGPKLKTYDARKFGRYGQSYISDPTSKNNEFEDFNYSATIGHLLNGRTGMKGASHVSFPDNYPGGGTFGMMPNQTRCVLEMTWGPGKGLRNKPGKDFAVFESGSAEGFIVGVIKEGTSNVVMWRYQFPEQYETNHNANITTFDLSNFGLAEGEAIIAIRLRNVFVSGAVHGSDKVDDRSGEGMVVTQDNPIYGAAFSLLNVADGKEYEQTMLGPDIVFVVGLHDIEAAQTPAAEAGKGQSSTFVDRNKTAAKRVSPVLDSSSTPAAKP